MRARISVSYGQRHFAPRDRRFRRCTCHGISHAHACAARRVSGAQPADLRHGARRAHCGSAKKSGALITAKHALEQNREVFVFIGEDEKAFSGCVALEEDGAARIYTAEDVLKPFASRRRQERIEQLARTAENISHVSRVRPKIASLSDAEKGSEKTEKKPAEPIPAPESNLLQSVSEDAKSVYAALNDTPKHASELELELGMIHGENFGGTHGARAFRPHQNLSRPEVYKGVKVRYTKVYLKKSEACPFRIFFVFKCT